MKQVLAFGASNSKNSINKKLASWAVGNLDGVKGTVLDLNDFELPIYGIDHEQEFGIPKAVIVFNEHLQASDGIIISLAEHNGSYTAVFKNVLDWLSRIDKNVFKNKPMFLLSTSPGGRGGATVFDTALNSFPRFGAIISAQFSLPFFNKNFESNSIQDETLNETFNKELIKFVNTL